MRLAAPLAIWLLASCAAPDRVGPGRAHSLDNDGIAVDGTSLRIDFGRSADGAIMAMSRLVGSAPDRDGTCAAVDVRFVAWRGGPVMYFRDGAFLGWATEDGRAAGLSCGVSG